MPYDTFLSLEIGQGAGSSVAQGGDQRSRKSEGFDGRKIRVDEALATWAAQAAGQTAGPWLDKKILDVKHCSTFVCIW